MKHAPLSDQSGGVQAVEEHPRQPQVAALCYRDTETGKQVLMITSRDTGRWIIPKGWPVEGLDGPGSALQEAWEEAGVEAADISPEPIGTYEYDKGLGDGSAIPILASVYCVRVGSLADTYPEVDERRREWMAPGTAAELVDEPQLKEILRGL